MMLLKKIFVIVIVISVFSTFLVNIVSAEEQCEPKCTSTVCSACGCYVNFLPMTGEYCKVDAANLAKSIVEECVNAKLKIKNILCDPTPIKFKNPATNKQGIYYITLDPYSTLDRDIRNILHTTVVGSTNRGCCLSKYGLPDIHLAAKAIFTKSIFGPSFDKKELVSHELVHVFQDSYWRKNPAWFSDGVADLVTYTYLGKLDELESTTHFGETYSPVCRDTHYTAGYKCAAAFIKYIIDRYQSKGLNLCKLHKDLKSGVTFDQWIVKNTDHNVDKLWEDFKFYSGS